MTKAALIVASYQFDDPKFAELRAPIYDVDALTRVLGDEAIGGFDVRALVNEPSHVVREELEGFFTDRKRHDFLLLYFSCHGIKDPAGRLYFVCSNTKFDRLRATGISSVFVEEQIDHSASRKIVVLLDCCYSGAFTRGMTARASDTVDVTGELGGRGRVIITASKATEYAFESGELTARDEEPRPSVFTGAVVEALESGEADQDEDEWISVDELYEYVYERVREQTPNQTPGKVAKVEGELLLARSVRAPRVAPLPVRLRELLDSDQVDERIGATAWLARHLEADDPAVVRAARQALERLIDNDDSIRVRTEATRLLERHDAATATPTPPETAPEKAREPVTAPPVDQVAKSDSASTQSDLVTKPVPTSTPQETRAHDTSQSLPRKEFVKKLKRRGWGLGDPYMSESSPNIYYADNYPHKKPRIVIRGKRIHIEKRTPSAGTYELWKSFSLERETDAALEAIDQLGRSGPTERLYYYYGVSPEIQRARKLLGAELERLGYVLQPSSKHVYRDSDEGFPWPTRIAVRDTRVRLEKLNESTSKYELVESFSLEDELDSALDAIRQLKNGW